MPSPNLFPLSSDTKKDGEKQGLWLLFLHCPFYLVCVFLSCLSLPVCYALSFCFVQHSFSKTDALVLSLF